MEKLLSLEPNDLSKLGIIDWAYTEELSAKSYKNYEHWLKRGLAANLNYLKDERSLKRSDLKKVYSKTKSALVFLFDYSSSKRKVQNKESQKIASYVTGFEGIDYHYWIREKLEAICKKLDLVNTFFSIDTAPVLERDLAYRAGLGWFGKNSMLINRDHGSYFIIASIFLDLKLDLNVKTQDLDHCGNCSLCIDACPTNAIVDDKVIDASLCIANFTIEEFKPVPAPQGYDQSAFIYGCDICQDVCPWNKRVLRKEPLTADSIESKKDSQSIHEEKYAFFLRDNSEVIKDLEKISNREFKRKFESTPIARTGRVGVLKNLKAKA